MKKTLILFIFIFLFSGCYDYKEINNLAFVSGMGLDLIDDKYQVTLFILEAEKSFGEGEAKINPKILEGTGLTISDALNEINKKMPKELYLSDLNILILGEDVIKSKDNYLNFFMASTTHDMNPYVLLADNANKIYTFDEEEKHYNILNLQNILNNSHSQTSESSLLTMTDLFEQKYKKAKEIIIPKVTINNESLVLKENIIIKNNEIISSLNEKETFMYHLVNSDIEEAIYTTDYKSDKVSFRITKENSKVKTFVKNNKASVKVDIALNVRISEASLDEKMENLKIHLQNELTNELNNFISKLQSDKLDLFGFGDLFYKYHNNYFKTISNWDNVYKDLETNISLHLTLESSLESGSYEKN